MDKPPVIEEVDEPKEKKRSAWPWIVVGCVLVVVVLAMMVLNWLGKAAATTKGLPF